MDYLASFFLYLLVWIAIGQDDTISSIEASCLRSHEYWLANTITGIAVLILRLVRLQQGFKCYEV